MALLDTLRRLVLATVVAGGCLLAATDPALARDRRVAVVSYDQLGGHLGETIVVRTTLGSRRAGTLVRYTRTALRLKLGPRDGGVELDIPSSSVRAVEVAREPVTTSGDDSAKAN
ncbi:MAG TPA: hypothetical protein VLF18_22735 [Tahibacter sp.]|uniref:hypothetical protein n=1 Tax=Tahibacter sp. TaxID=2056211 RepID=UPI002C0FFCBD|nr:hypothetical protein [Tahibacter sp.]HSX63013.1 hypothetical protein [Tahibacter sp.]